MKKILIVIGTRPEAIKMAPLIKELEKNNNIFKTFICVTAQHRQMLDQVLDLFEIKPDYDLDIMKESQDLYDITSKVLLSLKNIIGNVSPDLILVHGDTTTTFAAALASFYKKIPIGHVEAGLRTGNLYSPWPEECNRKLVSHIAEYHFAPTEKNKINLLKENINESKIFVTGNTVIDALQIVIKKITNNRLYENKIYNNLINKYGFDLNDRYILLTSHRRENFGFGFEQICEAIKEIALKNKDVNIIYPVHLNPNVQKPVKDILSNLKNVFLVDPLIYEEFVYLLYKSYIILTDSGGIQEEGPSLNKPVILLRDTSERPEVVHNGSVKIVGTDKEKIIKETQLLINDVSVYNSMINKINPYGDGKASKYILDIIKNIN
jgi:UDP-N-acetylglucosamine 2-epimerase (non-hydrolysing)